MAAFSAATIVRTSPTSVATTGRPLAIASITDSGICSVSEVSANKSNPA